MIDQVVRDFHCDFRNAPCNNPDCKKGLCVPEREDDGYDSYQCLLIGNRKSILDYVDIKVKREAISIAKSIVRILLAKDGRKKGDLTKNNYESEVTRIASLDNVMALAKKSLADKAALSLRK